MSDKPSTSQQCPSSIPEDPGQQGEQVKQGKRRYQKVQAKHGKRRKQKEQRKQRKQEEQGEQRKREEQGGQREQEEQTGQEEPETKFALFSPSLWHGVSFDLDHTLARYNLTELYRLCYNLVVAHLCEHGYNSRNFRRFGITDMRFAQRGVHYDTKHGVMLKLSGDGQISRAYRGTRRLSSNEIESMYSDCQRLRILKHGPYLPEEVRDCDSHRIFSFTEHSMAGTIYLLMELVQMVIDGTVEDRGFEKPLNDVLAAYNTMYDPRNFTTDEGGFYAELKRDPELYLHRISPEFLQWLQTMRRTEIAILVFADGPAEYTYFILRHVVGPDWLDYFDAVIVNTKKPHFFTSDSRPFYKVENFQEREIVSPEDFELPHLYAQGSFNDLRPIVNATQGKMSRHILHVGDSFVRDVYAAYKSHCCHVVGIVSELAEEHPSEWEPLLKSYGKPSFWCRTLREQAIGIFSSIEDFVIIKPFSKVVASTRKVHMFMYKEIQPRP